MAADAIIALLLIASGNTQPEVIVRNGETIPELRACIDYVGRGALRSSGVSNLPEDPNDLLGHSLYHYSFRERAELLGHTPWRKKEFVRVGHSLRSLILEDALVFLKNREGRTNFIAWERVWKDKKGRPFVPIFRWPTPNDRGVSWEPLALRNFARRVEYRDPQPNWPDFKLAPEDDEPGVIETREGRTRVLYGVYLNDFPRLFEAARSEKCWR